jgi:hypothetical protein
MEMLGGMERPVGIAEELSRKKDEVCLAGTNDLICLRRRGDHTDGTCGNGGFATDCLSMMDLVPGAHRDLLAGMIAAGGDVDEIDAFLTEELRKGYGVVKGPAFAERFRSPVGGRDADEYGQMLGPRGPESADDLKGKAGAVLEAASVLVGSTVGERR